MKAGLLAVSLAILALTACQRSLMRGAGYEEDAYYRSGAQGRPALSVEQVGQPRKRAAVLAFWNDTPAREEDYGRFAATELGKAMVGSRRYVVPLEADSDKTTEDFVQSDQVRIAQLIREGRRLGVSVLVIGKIGKLLFRRADSGSLLPGGGNAVVQAELEIKIFDVVSGRELLGSRRAGDARGDAFIPDDSKEKAKDAEGEEDPEAASTEAFKRDPKAKVELSRQAIRQAVGGLIPEVARIADKMAWSGHVARISGKQVYVNAGRASGIIPGDILKVLTQGEDIYDPNSGIFLGRSPGQLKGTIEVRSLMGTDAAIAELHTGANFQEGDLVQLY